MEEARASWDEQHCIGVEVTDGQIETLCADIQEYRKKAGFDNFFCVNLRRSSEKFVDNSESKLQVCLDNNAKELLLRLSLAVNHESVPAELIDYFNPVFYNSAEDTVFKTLSGGIKE